MATPEAALLGTFQKHIEDMRSLVHCKICLKPFYEPFTLSCGHTYCYSCLSSWIGGSQQRQKNKNCPDCRTIITTEPCPNYTLRDLVHMFCNRAELLPEDESVQEHETGKSEEAQILAKDRSGRGLFKGVFGRRLPAGPLGRPQFIRDDEDGGIMRCPFCAHEVLGGMCTNGACGFGFDDMTNYSEDDIDSETGEPIPGHHYAQTLGPAQLPFGFSINSEDDSEGTSIPYISDDEDEDNSEMNDFIDDDEDHDLPDEEDDEHGYGTSSPRPPRVQIDIPHSPPYSYARSSVTPSQADYSDAPEHHYNLHSGDARDEDSDESDAYHSPPRGRPYRGYSPAQIYNIDYDSDAPHTGYNFSDPESGTEPPTDYDEDDSVREVSPPINHTRQIRRRIVDSDDEDEDNMDDTTGAQFSEEELADQSDGQDSDQSEDTAIRPPQSSLARRQRLERQRQSRAQRASSSAEPTSYDGGRRRGGGGGGGQRLYPVVDLTGYSSERPTATRVY